MPAYDSSRFEPPAPVALVTVQSLQLRIVIQDVPMLLDTGADVSMLPHSRIESLVNSDSKIYELEAFDGTKSSAPAVLADVQFLGRTFRGQFLVVETAYGVIGRNILNSLPILFDGPSRSWLEQQ